MPSSAPPPPLPPSPPTRRSSDLRREALQVHAHEGRLIISGVRRERVGPCEQYHRIERGHGSFTRSFQLPIPIDADRITADLRDGVLTVTCPKAADSASRRIHVS